MNKFSTRALGGTAAALVIAGAVLAGVASPAQAQGVMDGAQAGAAAGVQDPLAGANFGPPANLYPVTIPGTPDRFCHWLEKSNAEIALRREIANATWNAMQWNHLAYDLKQLKRELQARIARSTEAANAAARSGDQAAMNRHIAQREADRAAVRRIDEGIKAAEAQEKAADELEAQLRGMLNAVLKSPVNACGTPNTETIGFLGGSKYDLGGDQPALKPVEIPTGIPQRVCHPEDKQALVDAAFEARVNAGHNLEQWRMRAAHIDQALRGGRGDAATLEKAYHEAKLQAELWQEELGKARAAHERAEAIAVVDCSETADARVNTGGGLLGALTAARGSLPERVSTGDYADFGHRGERPFDGSEAERDLRDRLKGVETQRHAGHVGQPVSPVQPAEPVETTTHPAEVHLSPAPGDTPAVEAPPADGEAAVIDIPPSSEPESPTVVTPAAPVVDTGPAAPLYPDCPTHPGMPGTPEHVLEFHS